MKERPKTTMGELTTRPDIRGVAVPATLRDAVMPIFRQRRLALLIFCGLFCGAVFGGLLLPLKYEAEMKILVNRSRVDAVVTPDAGAAPAVAPVPEVSEQDLNSEVELLKSRDLLEQVVLACGLESRRGTLWGHIAGRVIEGLRPGESDDAARLARSVQGLADHLIVDPLKKTTMIRVAYASRDPQLSARVLQTLATLYQEKHAAVHRPGGTFSFFDQQTGRYRDELAAAEAQLTEFDDRERVIAPSEQKQLLLQQLSQFEAELRTDQASAYATAERARALRDQSAVAPERQTTQLRKLDNAQLLAQLEGTLLSLELKRSDMLIRYTPTYPPVQELETQIDDTRKAIAQARQSPVEETTTDRVPAQDWMATELAKAEAERAQLQAQAAATASIVRRYEAAARQLDHKGTMQDDLVRNVKAAEDSYLLYLRKREEARISDALDSQRIVNVSIAEAATVPALPTRHFGWLLIGGFFAAAVGSLGAAYAADGMNPSFVTPDELGWYLELKVLASIPASTARQ
jgi:uncharacterized protein involved in exopolysaccharide biosynthesis